MAGLLSVEELYKDFGGVRALNNVSLDVVEGKLTALIGPNGAGKTTLFNIITASYRATKGRIYYRGQRIDRLPPYEIPKLGIARTFQLIRLFKDLTVLENVMVGAHVRTKANVWQVTLRTASVQAEELATRQSALEILRFLNLVHRAEDPVRILPHGEQRLVELARAMACEPKLLLLDEPTGGLNPHESELLQNILRSILGLGVTVFLIEHDMQTVMNMSDTIVVLNYGEKVAEGTPEVIGKDPRVIKAYLGKEFK